MTNKYLEKIAMSDVEIARHFEKDEDYGIDDYKSKIKQVDSAEFKNKLKHILEQEKEHSSILKQEATKLKS